MPTAANHDNGLNSVEAGVDVDIDVDAIVDLIEMEHVQEIPSRENVHSISTGTTTTSTAIISSSIAVAGPPSRVGTARSMWAERKKQALAQQNASGKPSEQRNAKRLVAKHTVHAIAITRSQHPTVFQARHARKVWKGIDTITPTTSTGRGTNSSNIPREIQNDFDVEDNLQQIPEGTTRIDEYEDVLEDSNSRGLAVANLVTEEEHSQQRQTAEPVNHEAVRVDSKVGDKREQR